SSFSLESLSDCLDFYRLPIVSVMSDDTYLLLYELYVITLSRIMSSITAQQAKLDLELIPKEKRLDIRKCNGRLSLGKIQREPTFQVALALTPCYHELLITLCKHVCYK
ncbi:hypothetical protein Tco_0166103, partial [Tanacetum coccineum]